METETGAAFDFDRLRFGIEASKLQSGTTSVVVNAEYFEMRRLVTHKLKAALVVRVEPDGDGFIAVPPILPLFGFGESPRDAIEHLREEIESLYQDLQADVNYSDDWRDVRSFLASIIDEQ
jgi:hypothetical protein